ncbi:heavy-metal-associated domain-containing protein [Nocardioides sp. YIM 152315]|uniref:heavy-metal-associated domain-containing protein n=1 Tax=Nocardioides sp. YIM 152315 TaxID=3031760 RepID=UPI0023DB25AF|nr:heavy-metal-associated domain-containing protein [Nocardioides sp. YIM 152315]MDF1605659.1 heavy-metal-associated domain-containing protein [Nocardioides sp. YIM 152315]
MMEMNTTRTYRVNGMTCDHCVGAVTRELGSLDSVADVQVELATGDVTVRSGRPLDDAEVAAAIDEAGYELAS